MTHNPQPLPTNHDPQHLATLFPATQPRIGHIHCKGVPNLGPNKEMPTK